MRIRFELIEEETAPAAANPGAPERRPNEA